MDSKDTNEVIVIGAGIAGLYTAYLLINEGYQVTVLEAGPTYGGRIKSLTGFAKVPIELGAEFIHGGKSILYDLAEYFDEEIVKVKGRDLVWWQNQLLSEFEAAKNEDVANAFDFMENFWKIRPKQEPIESEKSTDDKSAETKLEKSEEISVENYLKQQPFYHKTKDVLAVFGMEYGTSNENLGIYSLADNDAMWQSGQEDFKLKTPILNLLREFVEAIGTNIHYNTVVKNIDYTDEQTVNITTQSGKVYQAKKAICTIPLSMLKKNTILFTPPLPKEKREAIATLGMDSGIKVFLKFSKRFWPEKMWELYGTTFCPLYYQIFPEHTEDENILVAYLMGKFAESFRNKSNLGVQELVLELDSIFGDKVASESLVESFIMDWKTEKFIEGTYSYNAPGSKGMREKLALPVNDCLFFGGEAANFNGHAATMHGAMETAERCVYELKNTLNPLT